MPYALKLGPNNGGAGYDIGDVVELTAEFTDNTGVYIDPTTVAVSVTNVAGTVMASGTYAGATITKHTSYYKASDIVYRFLYTTTAGGDYTATFTSTGTGASVEKRKFHVRD